MNDSTTKDLMFIIYETFDSVYFYAGVQLKLDSKIIPYTVILIKRERPTTVPMSIGPRRNGAQHFAVSGNLLCACCLRPASLPKEIEAEQEIFIK
jgi:hypothetical protein